jgi:hypothetical protein
MPLYFFRIRNGRYSGASEQGIELADNNAAWEELTSSCAEMVGGICRKLGRDTQWEMELLDERKQPVFRICLVADSMNSSGSNRPRANDGPAPNAETRLRRSTSKAR